MKIAIIAWGSLVWDPRTLQIKEDWDNQGPSLNIELSRVSKDGRLTLVIDFLNGVEIKTYYAQSSRSDLGDAISDLRDKTIKGVGDKSESFAFVTDPFNLAFNLENDNISSSVPCAKCGNAIKARYEKGNEFCVRVGGFKITSKPSDGGKWFYQGINKHSLFVKENENHFIGRSINRDTNEYYEKIFKIITWEIVREVKEPLTSHIGRGSAKQNAKI